MYLCFRARSLPSPWRLFSIGYPFSHLYPQPLFLFLLAASHWHLDMLDFLTFKGKKKQAKFFFNSVPNWCSSYFFPSVITEAFQTQQSTLGVSISSPSIPNSALPFPPQSGFSDPRTPLLLFFWGNQWHPDCQTQQTILSLYFPGALSAAFNINDCSHSTSVLMPLLKVPTLWLWSCCSSPDSPRSSWLFLPVFLSGLFLCHPFNAALSQDSSHSIPFLGSSYPSPWFYLLCCSLPDLYL